MANTLTLVPGAASGFTPEGQPTAGAMRTVGMNEILGGGGRTGSGPTASSGDSRATSMQPAVARSNTSASANAALLELELRGLDVDERRELIDIAVAVVVQRDVGRKIERRRRHLRRKRAFRVGEVVVAIDEDARGLVGDGPGEALERDVGEAQVGRALDVQLVEFLPAARIEDQR